jgi:long-chain fatty acid transport protein
VKFNKIILTHSIAVALAALSGTAAASGFALIEQSASGLGNAYAGGAASAEDASTVFFNPAGMSRIPGKQIAVALHAIDLSAKFTDTGSTSATGRPLGTSGVNAGNLAFVPNGYFTMEMNPQTRFGLGVNAPFGLKTDYPAGWMGRFQAMKSSIETVNVNPSLSYQMSDTVSVGMGLNYQKINAELTSARSFGGAGEGSTTLTGSDDAWGYNFGMLISTPAGGRIGLAYRSSINYVLSGTVVVLSPAGAVALNTPITAALKTPDTISLSYFQALDDKWDVMADISRTGWSSFNELRIIQVSNGSTLQLTPENWSNTWRYSVGATHHYNEKWLARVGIAYDQAGVSDADRTARIPDNNRTWLALGGQYKPDSQSAIDFGYAHLFVKDSTISNNTGAAGTPSTATVGNLVGNYNNSVDILSVQYTRNF